MESIPHTSRSGPDLSHGRAKTVEVFPETPSARQVSPPTPSGVPATPSTPGFVATPPRTPGAILRRLKTSDCLQEIWVGEDEVESVVETDKASSLNSASAAGHHDHGEHKDQEPSMLTAVPSAVINFLLMFGLCCAYGMILFDGDMNSRHVGLGVKINLGTAVIAGVLLALLSGIPVAIGGPDLNPVVFLGSIAATIAVAVAQSVGLDSPDDGGYRRLKDDPLPPTPQPTDYPPASACDEACEAYHEQLRATVLMAVALTSAAFALLFLGLGKLQLGRYVTYVPTSVMEAFLSCVGYKVFYYAIKFCRFDPVQFLPAAFIGVAMYFVKAAHIGHPAVVLPLILLLPLAAFHVYAAFWGGGLDEMRKQYWMFPKIENAPFYAVWTDGIASLHQVNWSALLSTWRDMVTMGVVVVLDCMLKVSATESKLPVKYKADDELVVYGLVNVATALCSTSVGYMQLKFNVINFGVLGNVSDRRAGLMYAGLCGVFFFWSTDLINILPRFFLSTMLFFAGAGFVAENLWGSRYFLSFFEWMHIVAILAVFIATGQILHAVIVGIGLTCLDFLRQYATISTVRGGFLRGSQFAMTERHDPLVHLHLFHVLDSWLLVVPLKGFIFFGSAQSVKEQLKNELGRQRELPEFRKVRFLLFDAALLDGLDASAAKTMRALCLEAAASGVMPLWADVSPRLLKHLVKRSVVTHDSCVFPDMYAALLHVERRALQHLLEVQRRWHKVHPIFERYHSLLRQQKEFEPFENVFSKHVMAGVARGNPWKFCDQLQRRRGDFLWEPAQEVGLFIVHRGAVAIFQMRPSPECLSGEPGARPLAIYRHGWFLNIQALTGGRAHHFAMVVEDAELVVMGKKELFAMVREEPVMSAALTQAALRQQQMEAQLHSPLLRNRTPGPAPDEPVAPGEPAGEAVAATGAAEAAEAATAEEDDLSKGAQADAGMHPSNRSAWSLVTEAERDAAVIQQALPHALSEQLRSLRTVEELTRFGFFEEEAKGWNRKSPGTSSEDPLFCTPLPARLREHLLTAFKEQLQENDAKDAEIPAAKANQALKYAGIFDTMLESDPPGPLTQEQFLAYGRDLLMSRLTQRQQEAMRSAFKRFDAESSGMLDQGQVETLFREHLVPHISIDEIDGIASTYRQQQGVQGGVCLADFMAMMSRFLRAHELEYQLSHAMVELQEGNDRFTAASLSAGSHQPVSEEEAQEMLWVADWHSGGEGEQLGTEGLLSAVSLLVDPSFSGVGEQPGHKPRELLQEPSAREAWQCWGRLDDLLNRPASSRAAMATNALLSLAIFGFLACLIVEPLVHQHPANMDRRARGKWWLVELVFTAVFTVELLLRLATACAFGRKRLLSFAKDALTICDLVSLLVCYVDLLTVVWQYELGLLRCVRLLHLMRHTRFQHVLQKYFYPGAAVLTVIWGIFLANPPKK